MSNLNRLNSRTKIIASIVIFSALYAALRVIPTIPMIGTQATFHLSDVVAPIYGILLGPYTGGLSIIIGTFAAMGMGSPVTFLGLDFLPAFVAAVSLGFLIKRKWLPVIILNIGLLLAYVANPLTLNFVNTPVGVIPYLWMHLVAFVVLISPLGRKAGQWVDSSNSAKVTAGFAILALIGTMMQHLMGGVLFEVIPGQIIHSISASAYPGIWNVVFYVYPIERSILILAAVLIGVPVTRVLKKSFFASQTKTAV